MTLTESKFNNGVRIKKMTGIKVTICYRIGLYKVRIFSIYEDYAYFMKQYGFDPEEDKHTTMKNGSEIEYFLPKTILHGIDEDDKNLCIDKIFVDKNWGLGYDE